jgi:Wax ester synthase-like Acyl-CoA acyltransferase domain
MSPSTSRLRARFGRSASKGTARRDNRLEFFDQATFLSLRASGREQLMQIVWIYEHPVDFDKLRRTHHNGGYGLLGRRIERSPLPFGRHRWVAAVGQPLDIDIAESARPRAELGDWADERAQLPIDPEFGPGWHLGVLPLTDGSTAVTVVLSHCLADGIAGMILIVNAVTDNVRDIGYPPPHSRTRLRAAASDFRETVQGLPQSARALIAAAKLVYRSRRDTAQPAAPRITPPLVEGADSHVIVPAITIYVDLDTWDARANALNGNSYSLFAGVAAKLGEHLGRSRPDDGTVTLLIPYSDRTLDDTRAIAMSYAKVSVDPARVTTDLSGARVTIKQALTTARETPDPALQILPLTPFIPKRVVRRLADLMFGFGDSAVLCSNLGDLPAEIACADGTAAEYVMLRPVDQGVTRQYIESSGGQLVVAGARLGGKMSMTVVAYQPGRKNSKQGLRELAVHTIAEFGLTGTIE